MEKITLLISLSAKGKSHVKQVLIEWNPIFRAMYTLFGLYLEVLKEVADFVRSCCLYDIACCLQKHTGKKKKEKKKTEQKAKKRGKAEQKAGNYNGIQIFCANLSAYSYRCLSI